jgi:uncharacterized protein
LSPFSHSRRQFLFGITAAGALAVAGDGLVVEPNLPRVVHKEFFLPRLPEKLDGFSIALLSDFHYDPYFSKHPLHAAIPKVNALRPDVIALAGDFVSTPFVGNESKGALAADPCAALLKNLSAPYGLWSVLGNHDLNTDAEYITRQLQARGIQVLVNKSIPMERDGARFWLTGVDDVLGGGADLGNALKAVPAGDAVVLLAHEPDFADEASQYPVDLQLSGHSHGGQVRIPLLPPLYLPAMAKKYVLGTYQVGPLQIYTNAGLGTINIPVRFNCPPEITFIRLRSAVRRQGS